MIKDVKELVKTVTKRIKEDVDIAVLGMSGGADSTLCAILCKLALGEKNVYSIHMPYGKIDLEKFNIQSTRVADQLKLKKLFIPVTSISDTIIESLELGIGVDMSVINSGNARSRARMTVLYGVSHALNDRFLNHPKGSKKVRVINTCNWSETKIGYDTKFGDGAGDISLIGDLQKDEVYQLLDYFSSIGVIKEEHIDRVPSAGLWDGQSDAEELGMTYPQIDEAIRYIEGKTKICDEKILEKVEHLSKISEHKKNPMMVINLKKFCK